MFSTFDHIYFPWRSIYFEINSMKDENLMKSRAALHASAAMSHSPFQVGFVDNTFFKYFYQFHPRNIFFTNSPFGQWPLQRSDPLNTSWLCRNSCCTKSTIRRPFAIPFHIPFSLITVHILPIFCCNASLLAHRLFRNSVPKPST